MRRVKEGGFSLLELLIALVIFTVGMLGVAGIQTLGIRTASVALDHTRATQLGVDIVERMRVNRDAFDANLYNVTYTSSSQPPAYVDCSPCSIQQQAKNDLAQWYAEVMQLKDAKAKVVRDGNSVTLTLEWTDVTNQGIGDDDVSGEEKQTFVYTARMDWP